MRGNANRRQMNVLILTDFSAVSINAARYSLSLLREVPAKFHVLNIDTSDSSQDVLPDERESIFREKLQGRIESLRSLSQNKDHRFEALFSRDNLLTATRRYVEEKNIDLIVMGAVRRDFLEHTLIGNHTYEIMKKVKCNLLAIPENSQFVAPREVAIPIDYSVSLDKRVLQFLGHSTVSTETRFTVMEVREKVVPEGVSSAEEKDLFYPLSDRKLRFTELETEAVASKEQFMQVQKEFDMLVILGRNLSICDRFLHTEHGLYSSVENRLPILVLHG